MLNKQQRMNPDELRKYPGYENHTDEEIEGLAYLDFPKKSNTNVAEVCCTPLPLLLFFSHYKMQ